MSQLHWFMHSNSAGSVDHFINSQQKRSDWNCKKGTSVNDITVSNISRKNYFTAKKSPLPVGRLETIMKWNETIKRKGVTSFPSITKQVLRDWHECVYFLRVNLRDIIQKRNRVKDFFYVTYSVTYLLVVSSQFSISTVSLALWRFLIFTSFTNQSDIQVLFSKISIVYSLT